jgi:hypothetical protein
VTNIETDNEKTVVHIGFNVSKEEYKWLQQIANWLYDQRAIPKPSVPAFAKASTFKWYNEVNEIMRKAIQEREQAMKARRIREQALREAQIRQQQKMAYEQQREAMRQWEMQQYGSIEEEATRRLRWAQKNLGIKVTGFDDMMLPEGVLTVEE